MLQSKLILQIHLEDTFHFDFLYFTKIRFAVYREDCTLRGITPNFY